MPKLIKFTISILVIAVFGLAIFVFVGAQTSAVCGDGIVQSLNDDNENEQCDDAGESYYCTASCAQKVLGWGWARHGGWVSLSCANLYNCSDEPSTGVADPYHVIIGIDNSVSGWGWSDNLGWVCFGATCGTVSGFGAEVPAGGWVAYVEPDGSQEPPIKGWAKILALGDNGWLSLSCENDDPSCAFDYQVTKVVRDFGNCNATPTVTCTQDKDCPSEESCSFRQSDTLSGLSWNADADSNGVGYIWFNPPINFVPAWLQTKFGDIYAQRGLTGQPAPSFNATYRILSGGGLDSISNFLSESGNSGLFFDENFGPINFPTPETRYSNVLGKLDVPGILCDGSCGNCINQFGTPVVEITGSNLPPSLAGGSIYCTTEDLVIDNPITFNNATNFNNGAITFVVNGDLNIEDNLFYQQGSPDRFINLASVAWIVQGDLNIAPNVSEMVGNFIVLGDETTACTTTGDNPGCGQIKTCSTGTNCDNRLTISGLLMAKKFFFDRQFSTDDLEKNTKGTEIIIYDGRMLANTPPGLVDFAKALPIWRSGIFSQ